MMKAHEADPIVRLENANPVSIELLSRLDEEVPELASILARGQTSLDAAANIPESSARMRRGQSSWRRVGVAALIAAVLVIVLAGPAAGLQGRLFEIFDGTPVGTDQVSARDLHVLSAMARGVSPRVAVSPKEDVRGFQASNWRQLTVRDGRAYFAAQRAGGGTCVAIGEVGGAIGSVTCAPDFPSPTRPLLDSSVWRGTPGSDPTTPFTAQIVRLEGFAADGVARVGLLLGDGRVVSVTPVIRNVYVRADELPTDSVVGFVALDSGNTPLYTNCMAPAGCPAPR